MLDGLAGDASFERSFEELERLRGEGMMLMIDSAMRQRLRTRVPLGAIRDW
jgi:hypothetical protein